MSDKLSEDQAAVSLLVMAMQANGRFDEETTEHLLQVFDAGYVALEQRVERLAWAIRMVLRDFEDNDSPHLSVAAVKAVQSVEALALADECQHIWLPVKSVLTGSVGLRYDCQCGETLSVAEHKRREALAEEEA